ncbi:MAG: hypothetical protein JWQ29_2572 [Phenylobacterium sp.]|nr:hypothetical protein [Phenylobacterium sp.]
MTTSPQSAEQDIRLLDHISQLGMAMACDFQQRCLAVGDAREAADLALAFQRATRSVRQSIALKAKLTRDVTLHERDDRAHAVRETEARVQVRKAQVRLHVERAVWNEADGPEAERLLDELDDLLDCGAFDEGFVQGPVETHVARFCEELGVTPLPAAGDSFLSSPVGEGESPSPDGGAEESPGPGEPLRRSSG